MLSLSWLSVRSIDSAAPSPASWLVEEYIPANTVTLLSSVSGSGKSILALHLALSLLSGRDWLGFKCRQSSFAYWDQDNPDSWLTDNRVCAIRLGLGADSSALAGSVVFRARERVLGSAARIAEMIEWIRSIGATVLFVDTLASVNPYSENDPNQMARAIVDNFFPFVDAGITPIILHHIGKDFIDSKGNPRRRTGIHAPRGSSALAASVGAAFNLDRSTESGRLSDSRRLECVKPRYGSAPTVQLVYDEEGYIGSPDWKITVSNLGHQVSQDFVTQFITRHAVGNVSSRKLVQLLKDAGHLVSQSTAARALSRVR